MVDKKPINTEIISRLKEGDILAFEKVFNHMKEKVFYFALKILRNKENAEEALQETFFKLWESRHKIDVSTDISSYIFSIAHNYSIDILRKSFHESQHKKVFYEVLENAETNTENDISFRELRAEFEKAIDDLPEKRKNIFILSRIKGLSNDEISKSLGISKNTVENQIVTSIKYLRKRLSHFRILFFLI